MSLANAIVMTGPMPPNTVSRAEKKAYSEKLSRHLAYEVAAGLQSVGFYGSKPVRGGPGEKEFQGGLGPKKVDVSYADERHGLLLAVSIKTINFPQFAKNLPNRFSDLCTEAITLHMRFPYSVVCALFAFPVSADADTTPKRLVSTFQRATHLFSTISGRPDYTGPGEKFENITMLLYEPLVVGGITPALRLVNTQTLEALGEREYYLLLRDIYNRRNPHATIGDELLAMDDSDSEDEE